MAGEGRPVLLDVSGDGADGRTGGGPRFAADGLLDGADQECDEQAG